MNASARLLVADPVRAPAHRVKDQLYLLRRGYIYASPAITTDIVTGFPATILLSLRRDAFETASTSWSQHCTAVAKRPMVTRRLRADNPILSVNLSPNHVHYRNFRYIKNPGALLLDREAYAKFDEAFLAIAEGKLPLADAFTLFDEVIETTIKFLPRPRHVGYRVARALRILQETPRTPLEDVAGAVGLSYDRLSYLFAEAVGIPLRSYLLWQKIHVAAGLLGSGRSLTDVALAAGFADSAHLSNTWRKVYGQPPSNVFNNEAVQIHTGCVRVTTVLTRPEPQPN